MRSFAKANYVSGHNLKVFKLRAKYERISDFFELIIQASFSLCHPCEFKPVAQSMEMSRFAHKVTQATSMF